MTSQRLDVPIGETILVVDDDAGMCRAARRILESAGYAVLTADAGREALRLLDGHDGPVHLMLTDVVMPGMTGTHLAKEVSDRHPETKILCTSGYPDSAAVRRRLNDTTFPFIPKPYSTETLTRKIREVLDT